MTSWKSFLLVASAGVLLAQSEIVPVKTAIAVRTNDRIDARNPSASKLYGAVVDSDVVDEKGRVMIRRGTEARLILRDATDNTVVLDLESLQVNGRRYGVVTNSEAVACPGSRKKGFGPSKPASMLPPQTQVVFRLDEPLTLGRN